MRYRRADLAGGTYFFTVNPAKRLSDLLVRHIDDLHAVMETVNGTHPLASLTVVALPEHLHAIWLADAVFGIPTASGSGRQGSRRALAGRDRCAA